MKRPLALMALIALVPGLSGCVAAIPLASAVLVGESSISRSRAEKDAQVVPEPTTPAKVAATTPALEPEPEPAKLAEASIDQLAPGQRQQELPAAEPKVAQAVSMAPITPAPRELGTVGASRATGPVGPIAPDTIADPVIDALFANVTRIAQRLPSSREKRVSAVPNRPGSLMPSLTECRSGKTAVLIDLDPENAIAPLDEGVTASARLARILDGLRAQDVRILWLSGHMLDEAVEVRDALSRTGLDPTRLDPLYLPRLLTETKADRLADAAREFCVVAMLGDAWTDFDPAFNGAGDPTTAASRDALLGDVWFMAPPPLDPKG